MAKTKTKARTRNTKADFNFRFESRSQRKRFKTHAAKTETSVNQMLIDALWVAHPNLMKDDKNRKENIGEKAN